LTHVEKMSGFGRPDQPQPLYVVERLLNEKTTTRSEQLKPPTANKIGLRQDIRRKSRKANPGGSLV